MNKEFSSYFKRDFFEISAILAFIKENNYPFIINKFCNEWTDKNRNTQLSRENIEESIRMSLERYLYKKSILKCNLNDLHTIYDRNLFKIYTYINLLSYILENEYSSDKNLIIETLRMDNELERLGYSYNMIEPQYIHYKVSNLLNSIDTYNFVKDNIKEDQEYIKNTKTDILYELKKRKQKILDKKDITQNRVEKEIDKTEIIDHRSDKVKIDKTNQLEEIFNHFFDEVKKVIPNSDNKNEDFNKLKEEYGLIVEEKRNLEERVKILEKDIREMNNRYIELQNTIKSKECESNFKAIESIYKILNDKEDLFLDKIYASKNDVYKLNLEDIERMTSNMISNMESLGIRVNPMSKKINEKIIVKEEDLSNYRFSKKITDKVISNGSLEVSVRYPSWIYIDKEYSKEIRTLDNEMIE